ncbi:MAG: thiolase family protein [Myxococcota bacterium]
MKKVVIVSAVRTAIGSFGGMFKDISAMELGVIAAQEAIKRAHIEKSEIQDVIVGHCFMRTDEINIARCISLKAGIPFTTPAVTIQRQCSSSMQALIFGAQQIMTEENDTVLVGGVENMSRIPYVLKTARWGTRLKHAELTDMLWEGLTDPLTGEIMGITAENLAEKYNISREEQDEIALLSHKRAIAAIDGGRFKDEIVPVVIRSKKGDRIIDTDEHPRRDVSKESLAKLSPAFKENGTVTAGNASGINDGAAFAVIMSEEKAKGLGLKPLAEIVSHGVAGVEPELMGYGPVPATQKALKRAGLTLKDIDLIELNEAFAAQYLACEKLLGLNREITNVNGSGIALGHPVGCTGLRIIVSLIYEMKKRDVELGLATLCVGGGMGKAVIIRNIK